MQLLVLKQSIWQVVRPKFKVSYGALKFWERRIKYCSLNNEMSSVTVCINRDINK